MPGGGVRGRSLGGAFDAYVRVRKPPADDIIRKGYLMGLTETAGGAARLARDLVFFAVLKTASARLAASWICSTYAPRPTPAGG